MKDIMYLAVDLCEKELVAGFDSSFFLLAKRMGLNFLSIFKSVERNSTMFGRFSFSKLDLTEDKTLTGKYVIELYKEVPTIKNNSYVRHFPIITNLEQEKDYNLIYYRHKKQSEVLERYEFDNFIDFIDCRCDLVALGVKDKIKCYCEIKKNNKRM